MPNYPLKLLRLKVSKSDIDVPIKLNYLINKTLDNDRDLIYSILYKHYGIRKVKVIDEINVNNESELPELRFKHGGYINLIVFVKEE